MKRWTPYHFVIPLAEGEVPMDKGGFRTVTDKSWSSALEAVVYCKDCKFHGTKITQKNGTIRVRCKLIDEYKDGNWFCADGKRG